MNAAPDFNPLDDATWPKAMTADQVAAIYQRPVGGVKKACQKHHFIPAPYKVQPYRWRKADVIRDLEGGRALFRRVS